MTWIDALRNLSVQKPLLSFICLFIFCAIFRIVDIFVLRLDEPPVNEIILSKTLGLLFIALFLWIIRSGFESIGLYPGHLIKNLLIGLSLAVAGLVIVYAAQYGYLLSKGMQPRLVFQRHTLFALLVSVILGNLVNAFMEESLFRGLMIVQSLRQTTFWKANLLQAVLFGIWHIVWPIKEYIMGKTPSAGALIGACAGEFLVTFLMGLTMGYLVYQTGSLWAAVTWHFIVNFTQNILAAQNGADILIAGTAGVSSSTVKGAAFLIVLLLTNAFLKAAYSTR